MFSPAGQAWLHGGRRSRYTGRLVRHAPVLLARLEPISRVIANGLSIDDLLVQQTVLDDIAIGHGLDPCNAFEVRRIAEQMGITFLQLEVFGHGNLVPDRGARSELAVLRLEQWEQTGLDYQAGELDRVFRRRTPAEGAWHEDVNVARAVNPHRVLDLALEVAKIGNARRRDVGNAVRHRDARNVFAGAEDIARRGPHCRGRGGTRGRRCRARALHTRVHVRLVVVTDIEHVVVAFEHARQAAEADVGRAAVTALRNNACRRVPEHALCGGDAGRDRGRIAEKRVNPWNLPRSLRIRRREHFKATRCVDRYQLVSGCLHRGIDGVARAQRFAATLTGTVPGIERVRAVHVRLHRALVLLEQPIADGERAGLIELDHCLVHEASPGVQPMPDATVPIWRRIASAVGPVRRDLLSRSSSWLTRSAFRSRKVTCSSSSRPASSNSRVNEARVIARPPRPAMTV